MSDDYHSLREELEDLRCQFQHLSTKRPALNHLVCHANHQPLQAPYWSAFVDRHKYLPDGRWQEWHVFSDHRWCGRFYGNGSLKPQFTALATDVVRLLRKLRELDGVGEHFYVTVPELTDCDAWLRLVYDAGELCGVPEVRTGRWGVVRGVSIFRWLELDMAKKVVLQVKPAMPYRYCWGELGGDVHEPLVQEVAPALAHCREQLEAGFGRSTLATCFLSVHSEQNQTKFGTSITVDPRKLLAINEDDILWKVVEQVNKDHESNHGRSAKAIAVVNINKKMTVRETSVRLSQVISSLGEWSEPYEDNQQMCFWILD